VNFAGSLQNWIKDGKDPLPRIDDLISRTITIGLILKCEEVKIQLVDSHQNVIAELQALFEYAQRQSDPKWAIFCSAYTSLPLADLSERVKISQALEVAAGAVEMKDVEVAEPVEDTAPPSAPPPEPPVMLPAVPPPMDETVEKNNEKGNDNVD